jgi:hypothetical protein
MVTLRAISMVALATCFVLADAEAGRKKHCRNYSRAACYHSVCSPIACGNTACSAGCSRGCTAADALSCGFSGRVFVRGADLCIEGEVGCGGYRCRINSCIRSGTANVNCGDLQVRLRRDGNRVCAEARVRICVPYLCCNRYGCRTCYSCHWTGWQSLGCYGP